MPGVRSMTIRAWCRSVAMIGLLGVLLGFAPVRADEQGGYEMTTYYVAFLKRGPAWTPEETEETRRLQQDHLAHIGTMAASGDLVLAGPFLDGGELRGMFVFAVDSLERAEALAREDPAVKAGRLVLEFHPWYSAKGIAIVKEPAAAP